LTRWVRQKKAAGFQKLFSLFAWDLGRWGLCAAAHVSIMWSWSGTLSIRGGLGYWVFEYGWLPVT
jgi:hypothetical protein